MVIAPNLLGLTPDWSSEWLPVPLRQRYKAMLVRIKVYFLN